MDVQFRRKVDFIIAGAFPICRWLAPSSNSLVDRSSNLNADARRDAKNCGEYRQVARTITQDLIRGPSYNGSLVVSATENTHAATAPTCDFRFGYDRTRSLRLHLHAETVKKITLEKLEGSSFRRTSTRLFRPRRRKGQ